MCSTIEHLDSDYQPPLNACLACGRAGGGDRAGLPKHDLFY